MPLLEKLGAEFFVSAVAVGIPVEAKDTPQIIVATCFDCAEMIRSQMQMLIRGVLQ